MRKKNRNYQFFKKCELDYTNILKQPNPAPDLVTRLLNKRNKAHDKAREAANDSSKANRRTKAAFHNTVNNTLRNPSLSATKKFSILFNLMKNTKHCNIPPIIENDITVQDPTEQSNIFNNFFVDIEGFLIVSLTVLWKAFFARLFTLEESLAASLALL